MWTQPWQDEHGVVWEIVAVGEGDYLVRQGLDLLSVADGDVREGVEVMGRFSAIEDAEAFLWQEGFEPM